MAFVIALLGGAGVFTWISDYETTQARTPHALSTNTPLTYAPAANTTSATEPTASISKGLSAKLAAERNAFEHGKSENFSHVKELPQYRTANSNEYLNKDGTKSVVYTAVATNYKAADGTWQNINNSLVQDPNGVWHTTANTWITSFGNSKTYGIAITDGSNTFRMLPQGTNAVDPTVTGSGQNELVTYKNIWKGVNLQYAVNGSEVKESIILSNSSAASQYSFNYSGSTLTPITDTSGSYALSGAFSGFDIAAPTISTFNKGIVEDALILNQTADDSSITVNLNANWLQQEPKAAFPIVIDPTVFVQSVGNSYEDFTSNGGSCIPGSGCGEGIGYDATYTGLYWRFVYNTTIPTSAGQYLVSAKLNVQQHAPDGVHYYGVTGPTTITLNHASCTNGFNCIDTSGTYGSVSSPITSSASIEMAPLYNEAITNGQTDPSFIANGDESGANSYKLLDDTQTTMTFTYETLPTQTTIGTTAPVNNGTVASTEPILSSTVEGTSGGPVDPDGPGPYEYRYIIGTGENLPTNDPFHIQQGVTGVIADSGLLNQATWAAPANVLQDGHTYYWQPIIWDGYSGAPQVYGPVYSFTVNLRNGKDATQSTDISGPVTVDMATGNLETSNQTQSVDTLDSNLQVGLDYNSPQRSQVGLIGQYWNDPGHTQVYPSTAPSFTRTDANVNFNWGTSGPYPGVITGNNYLVKWTGYFVAPQTDTYEFGTTSTDESRVFVNGTDVANGWSTSPTNLYSTGIALTAGQIVPIEYDYSDGSDSSTAQMLVQTTDGSIAPQVIPSSWLQTGIQPIATPHGLLGHYYTDDGTHTFDATNLGNSFLTRTDTSMNLNWGTNSPVPGGPTNNYIVKWTGYFTAPVSDTYTFGAGASDGARVILTLSGTQTTVLNQWQDQSASQINYGTPETLSAGQTIPIEVDYYEDTNSNAQMSLYMKQASLPTAPNTIVNSTYLSPSTEVLPDGWNLSIDDAGMVNYDYAVIAPDSVTLYDSQGEGHEYTYTNGIFTPPAGETGDMVRNGDGTITLQDSDGQTYVFNTDGTLKSATSATDDLNPAALQYTYGSSNGSPAHLIQITDGVTSSRWMKLIYSGDPSCPTAPSGFNAASPAGMICAATSYDGNTTDFFYANDAGGTPRLSRIVSPGNDETDYGYNTAGQITQVRNDLANDAVAAGVRAQDNTAMTTITYDALGRVASVTQPAATAGASQLEHTYQYLPNNTTEMHVVGATEPNGFTRKITYDGTYRTLTDTDVANLTTTTVWDPVKDLQLSSTDPTGLETTYLYDYDYRLTDTYGPAPSSDFDNTSTDSTYHQPLSSYTSVVSHNQTAYDQNIPGLAAAYYNVTTASNGTGSTTAVLTGAPTLHSTGIGPADGDVLQMWNGTPPFTPASGDGWGLSLTGDINLASTGNYTFRIFSNDGVRLWVDNNLVINDWNNGAQRSHPTGTFNVGSLTPNTEHKIELQYYNAAGDTNAELQLYMTPPGGSETSTIGNLMTPLYSLPTTTETYDSSASVGNEVTTNNYGTHPELGLVQSSTQDPSGQNLTTSYTYEPEGTSGDFLRKLSQTLPGGATTNYAYYAANATVVNPCNSSQTFYEGGMLKTQTDPTGVVTQYVYDDDGNTVATEKNSDPWTCYTFDARQRETKDAIPALSGKAARTVTYNYAVSSNPLVTSVSDSSGTLTTTSDLLGRTTTYADTFNTSPTGGTNSTYTTNYTYDNLGRESTIAAAGGTESYVYDNNNRISGVKYNNVTVATPTYDAYGRLQTVTYPAATTLGLTIARDSLGRETGVSYNTYSSGTLADSDTLSQSNKITAATDDGIAQAYTYDGADRLTQETYGNLQWTYGYGMPTGCTGSYNANAGKDSNRTTQTETQNGSQILNYTYCYNNADQLISSTNPEFTTATYDSHGNLITGSSTYNVTLKYDSSDRVTAFTDNGSGGASNLMDPDNRVYYENQELNYDVYGDGTDAPAAAFGNTLNITERYLQLPGGVMATVKNVTGSPAVTSTRYSLPDLQGNIFGTTYATGQLTSIDQYDAFGQRLGSSIPINTTQQDYFGDHGESGVLTDGFTVNQFTFMGDRLYIPTIGRFAQTDPIEDGNANAYVYPADPINNDDVTGDMAQRGTQGGGGKSLSNDEQKLIDEYGTNGRGPTNPLLNKIWKSAKQKLKNQAKYNKVQSSRQTKDITKQQRQSKINQSSNDDPDGDGGSSEPILPFSDKALEDLDLDI